MRRIRLEQRRRTDGAGDITVLIADALRKTDYYAALRRKPLPKPASWIEEGIRTCNTVLIDTIQRFKGLESPIVILWGMDTVDLARANDLLYVGMSRDVTRC
jgi:superfamily I DNA and RNA helicase